MAVRETLELDLRSALSGLAQIDRSLAGASSRFSTALAQALSQLDTKIDIDADVSGVSESIDAAVAEAETVVEVEADTAAAVEEIEGIEAPDIVVEVDADVSAAEEQIESLGDTAQVAAKNTSGLGGAVTGLQAAAGLAVGQTASLADGVAGISTKTAGAVSGVLALAGSTKVLFDNALEAIGAEQRLEQSLGNLAGRVDRINVGSLNEDLGELAIKLGSSDDAIRDAVSSIFQFGTSSGVAGDKVEVTAEQLVALAARAVALRPSLGDVGDVAESMGIRLARGGRFAAQFGIALNAADIEARAREMFHLTGEVGIYEKVAAAADLATQKYGASLRRDIEQGSKNPILQVRSLRTEISEFIEDAGRPLVLPVIGAFREAVPAVSAFASAVGAIVEAGLPVVVVALQVATPVLEAVAEVLTEIPAPLLQISAGIVAIKAAGGITGLASLLATPAGLAVGIITVGVALSSLTGKTINASEAIADLSNVVGKELARDALTLLARNTLENGVKPLATFRQMVLENVGAAKRFADSIGEGSVRIGDQTISGDKLRRIIAQVTAAQKENAEAAAESVGPIEDETDAFEDAASAADTFKTALDKLIGVHISAVDAEIEYKDNLVELTKQLQENKGNLDINTDAGRRNIASALQLAESAQAVADAAIREGKGVAGASAIMENFTQVLREQLLAASNAPEVVEALLQRIGLLGGQFNATGMTLGQQLALGLADGIDANAYLAERAAAVMGQRVDEAFSLITGIGSPSRVFMNLGKQLVAGLALGLSDTGPATTASARLGIATTSGFSSGLRAVTAGGTGGQVSQTPIHNPISIVVQAPMPNPAAVGLETARVLRREQFLKGR